MKTKISLRYLKSAIANLIWKRPLEEHASPILSPPDIDLADGSRNALRHYHCNNCGALALSGESHKCDPERLAQIERIADFLKSADREDYEDHEDGFSS